MSKEKEKLLGSVERIFLPIVRDAFGANLASVTLYGSSVAGGFVDGLSDVNVLIIIAAADPDGVSAFGRNASRVMKKSRITPLLLTEKEFVDSADVFPMEYLDIRDSRKVIFGEDLAARLQITKRHLRHQAEGELRGTVTALRRAMLETGGKQRPLKRILREWFGSQVALFRGLLRLADVERASANPVDSIAILGRTYGIDVAPIERAARLRDGERLDAKRTTAELLLCLTELVEKVDAMDA